MLNLKSFTLLELLVSLGIIIVVITLAGATFMSAVGSRHKSLGQVSLQQDAQYLMDLLTKDIRESQIDYSGGVSDGQSFLNLIDLASGKKIRYWCVQADGTTECLAAVAAPCPNPPCSVKKRISNIDGSGVPVPTDTLLTSSKVSVERLNFYISPTFDPFTQFVPSKIPRATIVLRLKSLEKKAQTKELNLQQTVSQRYLLYEK